MPVESPAAGTVASIAVEKGQAVEEGEVLLTLK
jgi:biotin carboxyl carrier protein